MVQWLRFHAFNAGGPGSIPSQVTRFQMPQLKILHAINLKKKKSHVPQLRPSGNQINIFILKKIMG